MPESVQSVNNVRLNPNTNLIAQKQQEYCSASLKNSLGQDVVEIQGKTPDKNSRIKKYAYIVSGVISTVLATAGVVFGYKKIKAHKAEKEAQRLAQEAREKAQKLAQEAAEKARIEAEREKKVPEIVPQKVTQERITTNKKIFTDVCSVSKYDEIIKNRLNVEKYGKNGIPLKYSRNDFLQDLNNTLNSVTPEERTKLEKKFNLVFHKTTYNPVGIELEQIPVVPKQIGNIKAEEKIAQIINKFTSENEVLIDDKEVKTVLDSIIQEIPEFTAMVGRKQHDTHHYSVDIHTLRNLSDNLNNIRYNGLDDESKQVLKYSTILHDLGKDFIGDFTPDKGHAKKSLEIAKGILERLELSSNVKERILKQVENHHWFEHYNKGQMSAQAVVNLFASKDDITIAQIMAKSDLQNVNPNFHFWCMGVKGWGDYCEIMFEKFAPINKIANKIIAEAKGLKPDRHGITPISCDGEYFEELEELRWFRLRNRYEKNSHFNTASPVIDNDYTKNIPRKMLFVPAYTGNGAGGNIIEFYKDINKFLAQKNGECIPVIKNIPEHGDIETLLKDYLVNFDSETVKRFIRCLDYSLKELDKEFGKFEGLVYRNGKFSADGGQYYSASRNPSMIYVGDKSEFHIIKTKNGHKIVDFKEKYFDDLVAEEEILLSRDGKYREITDGSKYQEEKMKMAQSRYKYYKELDEKYYLANGQAPHYNYSLDDILAKIHVWEEV